MNRDESMWCLLMFDLPTLSKQDRRESTQFRNALLDQGFFMVQLSVYGKHTRFASELNSVVHYVKRNLPEGGEVRMAMLSDTQWSKMFRFVNGNRISTELRPDQLSIF